LKEKNKKEYQNSKIKAPNSKINALNSKFQTLTSNHKGITLIALVVTILFSYDEMIKFSNSKGFLLATI